MKKIIKSNFQINLLSLALLFLIPITLSLGVNFFFPKINQSEINNLEENYVKTHMKNFNQNEFYKQRFDIPENSQNPYALQIEKWKKSEEYKNLISKNKLHDSSKIIIFLMSILLLFISLSFIPFAIFKTTLILACLYLYLDLFLFKSAISYTENIIEIISSLIFLIIILFTINKE